MAQKSITPPVFREPVTVEQLAREIRDIHDMLDNIFGAISNVPVVKMDPSQSGNQAVFRLEISDLDKRVTAIEYRAKTGPETFQGPWLSDWSLVVGVIGGDQLLIREVRVAMQETHNTTIIGRVQYPDQFGVTQEIFRFFTYDIDEVATILGFEVAIDGATARVNIIGDEDTASIWKKLLGQADSLAVKIIDGRNGTWNVGLTAVIQEYEIAGKNKNGVFGVFVPLTLHKAGAAKVILIPATSFVPIDTATTWFFTTPISDGDDVEVKPGTTATLEFLVTSVVLPPGTTITEIRCKVTRATTSDTVKVEFWKGGVAKLADIQHASTGTVEISASISQLVSADPYIVVLSLFGSASFNDASLHWVKISYDTPSFEASV